MIIRKAEIKDTGRIMQLLVQVNNVHNANRPDLFIKDKTKYTEDELKRILDDPLTPVFVAVDETDNVLGYCFGMFQSHKEDNNFPDITTYYIDDLCVDESHRGEHIGKALYNYTVEFAKKSGCYNVTLNVWDKNDSAIKFYENCGFKIQKYGMEIVLNNISQEDF